MLIDIVRLTLVLVGLALVLVFSGISYFNPARIYSLLSFIGGVLILIEFVIFIVLKWHT